jgi:hypothetical protein
LIDIVRYCKIIFRNHQVLQGIASYCPVLPGIAPAEEKRTNIQIVLFVNVVIYFHVVSICIVKYMLGIVQYHVGISQYHVGVSQYH